MIFKVSSSAFFDCLQITGRVISTKNTIAILNCLLFEIKDNKLYVTGSDSDNTLVTALDLIESDGYARFCINAKTIQESMKDIAEQPLEFEVNTENLAITVKYLNGHFDIMGQSADEYPEFKMPEGELKSMEIQAAILSDCISRCLYATSDDDMRPTMCSLCFDLKTDHLAIASTDGHRMVRNQIFNITRDEPAMFLLPKKPGMVLKGILAKEEYNVTVQFNTNSAYFQMQNSQFVCRLTEGRYPNYNAVIPSNNPFDVTVDRMAMLGALKRVLVFSGSNNSLISLHIENNMMKLSGQDVDFSMYGEEYLPCDYTGDSIDMGFKGTYLADIVGSLPGDNIIIKLADPSRPGVLVPAEQEENQYVLMLLMPMMLNE